LYVIFTSSTEKYTFGLLLRFLTFFVILGVSAQICTQIKIENCDLSAMIMKMRRAVVAMEGNY
jgi:hypothetical protein